MELAMYTGQQPAAPVTAIVPLNLTASCPINLEDAVCLTSFVKPGYSKKSRARHTESWTEAGVEITPLAIVNVLQPLLHGRQPHAAFYNAAANRGPPPTLSA
jgi:hypothetical protein